MAEKKTTTKRKPGRPKKIYKDEDGNPVPNNSRGLPIKTTPEVRKDVLERVAKCPSNKEEPTHKVGNRRMYESQLAGIVYNINDPESRKRMLDIVSIFFAFFQREDRVAEYMGVRQDQLKSWLREEDFRLAMKRGRAEMHAKLLHALYKKAIGGTYIKESVSKGEIFKLEQEMPGDTKALELALRQIGKKTKEFSTDQQEIKTAIQINITGDEANY